ncbi:hypothetical protein CFAM422_006970 [Trichoderma lentiforme]|uniref:Uncharacterized protein n=1 Tax=Trichoderma lentiforme TaxID=1567552 RepID=A0A9P4XE65_9HYPO|nr:hypothetical protein CFAM422_006970 [Trichoderma lentiforme]
MDLAQQWRLENMRYHGTTREAERVTDAFSLGPFPLDPAFLLSLDVGWVRRIMLDRTRLGSFGKPNPGGLFGGLG